MIYKKIIFWSIQASLCLSILACGRKTPTQTIPVGTGRGGDNRKGTTSDTSTIAGGKKSDSGQRPSFSAPNGSVSGDRKATGTGSSSSNSKVISPYSLNTTGKGSVKQPSLTDFKKPSGKDDDDEFFDALEEFVEEEVEEVENDDEFFDAPENTD